MTRPAGLLIALLVLAGSAALAAGGSGPVSAVDPSDIEWTAERYLSARPMEPLRVKAVSRDQEAEELEFSLDGGPTGAPAREPQLRVVPDFERYIHEPGAHPRSLVPLSLRRSGLQSALLPTVGRRENRGTENLEFSSSRLVPRDARVVYPYSAVGKLFFDVPNGGSGYCSASVVNRRIVLTAGHCVYTPGKGWHKNFSFVPAFFEGNAPFGTWRVEKIWTTGEWFNGGNKYPNAADFGVLTVRDDDEGKRLGQVTGWLGWRTRSLTPNHLHILGYPSNLDKGNEMHQVASGGFDCCFDGTAIYGTDMRQGSSGGPWVQNFGVRAKNQVIGKNTQKNRVVGVYSWLYTDNKKALIAGSSVPKGSFAEIIRKACNDRAGNCN